MTEATKATRLSKAAKEFNVGIHTIVEYLSEKGIEIEEKPTAKISGEVYEILVQEFQTEKAVREEAEKFVIDTSQHTTIGLDDIDTSDYNTASITGLTLQGFGAPVPIWRRRS